MFRLVGSTIEVRKTDSPDDSDNTEASDESYLFDEFVEKQAGMFRLQHSLMAAFFSFIQTRYRRKSRDDGSRDALRQSCSMKGSEALAVDRHIYRSWLSSSCRPTARLDV